MGSVLRAFESPGVASYAALALRRRSRFLGHLRSWFQLGSVRDALLHKGVFGRRPGSNVIVQLRDRRKHVLEKAAGRVVGNRLGRSFDNDEAQSRAARVVSAGITVRTTLTAMCCATGPHTSVGGDATHRPATLVARSIRTRLRSGLRLESAALVESDFGARPGRTPTDVGVPIGELRGHRGGQWWRGHRGMSGLHHDLRSV